MSLVDYYNIKHFLKEKMILSSLKFGRNDNKNIKSIKKEIYNPSISNNILPKIYRLKSLNVTKIFPKNNNYISRRIKLDDKINSKSYTINANNTNKILNIIKIKNSLTHKKDRERFKINKEISQNKNKVYITIMNNLNNKNNNKMKQIRKIINIYYNENEDKNNKLIKNENKLKEEENQDINNNNKILNTNSMFMTEMNFLNDNNKNRRKIKEIKEVKNKQFKKIENEFKKTNYDYLSFKELLKHIENDKKKIINNQNDIDDMLKTTKDTYNEIWKFNHH